jgi:hypothetical protein
MRQVRASLYKVGVYYKLLASLTFIVLVFFLIISPVLGEQLVRSPRYMSIHSTVLSSKASRPNEKFSKNTLKIFAKVFGNTQLRFILSEVNYKQINSTEKKYQGFVFSRRGGKQIRNPATAVSSYSHGKTILVLNFSLPVRKAVQDGHSDKRVVYYRALFNRDDKKIIVNRAPYFAVPLDGCGIRSNNYVLKHTASKLPKVSSSQLRVIEVVTEADRQFVNKKGGSNDARIASLAYVNAADGIYRKDLSLSFDHKNAETSGDDFGSNNPELIHERFSMNIPKIQSDVHILFSGRNFDGATIGLAWLSGACAQGGLSAGIVQEVNPAVTHIVFAHEVGHLLGAVHDQQIVNRPECSKNFVMGTSLGDKPPTQFSSCSKNDIANFVRSKSECFSSLDLATPTPTITTDTTPTAKPSLPPSTDFPTNVPTIPTSINLSGGINANMSRNRRNINVTVKLSSIPGNLCEVTLYRTFTDSGTTVSFNRLISNKRQIFRIPVSRKIPKSLPQIQVKAQVRCAFGSSASLGPVNVKITR